MSCDDDSYLCYWDVLSSDILWSRNIQYGQSVFTVDISFNRALVTSGGDEKIVRLCLVTTGEEISPFRVHMDDITSSHPFNGIIMHLRSLHARMIRRFSDDYLLK